MNTSLGEAGGEVDGGPVGGPHPVGEHGVLEAGHLRLDRGAVREAESPPDDAVVRAVGLGGAPGLLFSDVEGFHGSNFHA